MNIKDYFSFTRGEKRGVVFLLLIILLLIISIPLISLFEKNESIDFSEFEEAIAQFEKERDSIFNGNIEPVSNDLFEFNPNTISDEEWLKLGFKKWQVKTINNYKAKGGNWKVKSDVKRIYSLEEEHYKKLEPFILLPEEISYTSKTLSQHQSSYKSNKAIPTLIIDINTADTSTFKQLKGIGTVYAHRIVKYRNALGGFTDIDQLKEVYGLTEETYRTIQPYLTINANKILKININSSDAERLKKHPYVDWKLANAIEKYRKANGNYQSIDDLKKIHLFSEETFLKIAPYLSIH
ncbi:MAG: helix-hairpin-helix domain-containing protein [Vicingus serpentipes]|nr:helix-hairpin-helix domain-containing protein [Vicingus serpentipes]